MGKRTLALLAALDSTGARVLAEIGDGRTRFADAHALKAYTGSAPITRACGRSICITHRHIKNNRLATKGWIWAFAAATNRPAARQHYRRRGEHGEPPRRRHPAPVQQTPRPALSLLAKSRAVR